MGKTYVSINKATEILGVTRTSIYNWVRAGKLEAIKIPSGSMRVCHESINKILDESHPPPPVKVSPTAKAFAEVAGAIEKLTLPELSPDHPSHQRRIGWNAAIEAALEELNK